MSWLAARTSLHTALFTQALILLATTLIPLTIVEKDPPEPRPRIGDVARSLATVFSLRSTAVTAFLMLVLMVPIGFLSANELVLFTQHVGWDPDRYGQLTGGLGLVASLVGSIAGGELADRIGVRRALAVVSLVLASAWCAFGLAKGSWQSVPFTTTFVLVEQACIAALLVSIFALCMNVSWSRIAATQFAAYMALSNFSGALGFRLSGVASTWFAVDRIYVIAAVVQVALTAIVVTIDPGETARALPLPPGARTPARGIAVVVGFAVVLAALTGFVVHGAL
jgi:MFS family permease